MAALDAAIFFQPGVARIKCGHDEKREDKT
jgi:hypothetical protein